MRRDTNKMNSKISLICLMTMISLSFGFPDRTQHNHNNHYDWQTHVLNIILHKNLTSQSTSTSLVPHPINVQSTGVTVSSAKTNDEQTEVDFKHIQASDGGMQHSFGNRDFEDNSRRVLIISLSCFFGITAFICCLFCCCVRSAMVKNVTKGHVIGPANPAPSPPAQTYYQQQFDPGQHPHSSNPIDSPPPYDFAVDSGQNAYGVDNPNFNMPSAPPQSYDHKGEYLTK